MRRPNTAKISQLYIFCGVNKPIKFQISHWPRSRSHDRGKESFHHATCSRRLRKGIYHEPECSRLANFGRSEKYFHLQHEKVSVRFSQHEKSFGSHKTISATAASDLLMKINEFSSENKLRIVQLQITRSYNHNFYDSSIISTVLSLKNENICVMMENFLPHVSISSALHRR